MNSTFLNNLFIFATGAAIGSVVTYIIMKKKYDETEYEYYEEEENEQEEESSKQVDIQDDHEQGMIKYNKIIKSTGYSSTDDTIKEEEEDEDDVDKPYVISPEEFAELDNYNTVTLYYYDDGVLADTQGNIIGNVKGTVGEDSLKHFGEYSDDCVYVRNDKRKTDYEILRDENEYSDSYPTEG